MGKRRTGLFYQEKNKTMKSAELKAYLEGVIADLPEQELDINVDMTLFFRWWDKPHGSGASAPDFATHLWSASSMSGSTSWCPQKFTLNSL